MKKNYKILEYSVLFFGLIAFVSLFVYYRFDKSAEIKIMAMAAGFYALWGMLHHLLEDRLTLDIAIEYLLIGFFVFLLVFTSLSV